MKVTVSVGGTFHAFQLAAQLERRGLLHRLITTHRPLRGEAVSRDRVLANPFPETFLQVPRRLRLPFRGDYWKSETFDRWARRHVEGCDLFVGFAAFSLRSIHTAKARGAVTVLERASAHVTAQQALLEEENRRFGYPVPPIDRRLVAKQLAEYQAADYIAVPSTFVYDSFIAQGIPPSRLIKVPLGVETRRFTPGSKRDATFRVVAAGLSLQKGTPYVLEAVCGLDRRDVELMFVGSMGYDVAPILARHAGRYRWPGYVDEERLAELMRQGSVFVQPSVQDGFGMMIPQAMAVGLPVICTTNTAGPDLIRDGIEGFVVPIRDPGALRERLRYLCERPDACRRMGEAAAVRVREFGWDAYGDRICAAYQRCVDAARGRGLSAHRTGLERVGVSPRPGRDA